MHIGIRAQLLFPLVPLILGLAATTVWTAYSAAAAARQQILDKFENIDATIQQVKFQRNVHTLSLMKGLSGADILVCDPLGEPLFDDQNKPLTTFLALPERLPEIADGDSLAEIQVAGVDYLSRRVRLKHEVFYLFLQTSVMRDAIARAVRPALVIGGVGGAAAIVLALWITQRLTRRIQDVQRRTRIIAAGDFSPMRLSPRRDELRDLGQSINDMADQLSRLTETLKSSERLRLLGQVSGGLAHQLRNSIAGAKLALQLLNRDYGSEPPESLRVAMRQLALMENYLKRFFDLGKAMQVRGEPVDLAALAEETVALLRPQCQHANTSIKVDAAPLRKIDGDPGQLRQVLFNLISNAIEAAGPGGRVLIRLRPTGSAVTLDVVDSGPGVPADVAAKLFEPFVTGKPEGVGLGLAVARQIVEAHGGTLTWSRESEGTRFRVELSK